jgi:hypothetical protein
MEAQSVADEQHPRVVNHLYEFMMNVSRGTGCDLAHGRDGAFVPSYVGAPDPHTAMRKAVATITAMHYIFADIEGVAREIPVSAWGRYVSTVWPDVADHLPSTEELPALVEAGAVFFGPFAGFQHRRIG